MGRLFGTDGIRGIANVDLKPTMAYALGRATAHRLVGRGGSIVVGQDTRRSGDLFVAAITAGATSLGVDVHIVGVVPTPALAFLTGDGPFAAGVMVSASHNPAEDNGLKVLDDAGLKLDDAIEDELEALIWRSEEL
ncbi:MAG TPA: phosphoglucosamine mutase, partial [Candidatus Limnocylindrales bacterium]